MHRNATLVCAMLALGLFANAFALHGKEDTEQGKESYKIHSLHTGTVEESDATSKLSEPHYGYTGEGGSFIISPKSGMAIFGIHDASNPRKVQMGHTKLEFVGAKRLSGVDGWVYKTQWNGKEAPSRIFFSAEPVYFGLGIHGYIAADYRENSKWAWKMIPLKRWTCMREESGRNER